ncbi:MAG: hypothetical protein QXJ97_03255 [Desulfurococcaceae archaeon]
MVDTRVSQLYIIELRTRGWAVGVSYTPEERILTTIFRLSKEQKNKLQYLKVKFYRFLDKIAVFTLGEKYVVSQKDLPEVEKEFSKIYSEFVELRREFYEDMTSKWDEIQKKLEERLRSMGLPTTRISRLKPNDESFLDMHYVVIPLSLTIDQLINVSEEFEKLAKERDEYRAIARRVREEAERNLAEVRRAYEDKIRELEKTVEELKKALKEQSREVYRLRLKAREVAEDAKEIAAFLGEETLEDLKQKLDALKEFFAG